MSFDVSVAGIALPTDLTALKSFQADLNLAFSLDKQFGSVLDVPLSSVPASLSNSQVSYTAPRAEWNPFGSPVKFGLSGGAGGQVEVLNSGNVCEYTDGLDKPVQKAAPLPAGYSYLKLSLDFDISASVSGAWSGGSYGVKASASDASTFKITFCKMFAPSTTLRVALTQVFQGFVLPFHAQTLEQMSVGDFLFYEFDGNLHLAFGAYVGVDKVAYAGQSTVDVAKCGQSPLATVCPKMSPEVKAGATFDLAFQYTNRFEALLSKLPDAAWLHLFRATKSDVTTSVGASLGFDANAKATIATHLDTVESSLVDAAGGADSDAGKAVGAIAGAAAGEVGKYADEVADKLNTWLNKANGLQTNLQVAIETSDNRTILAGYTFDLTSAAYPQAWKAAIDGDFVQAFQTGAVTLDAGSGLENEYRSKTCFTCNIFNLWNWTSWSEFQSTASLVYAGNNVFHLSANVGRASETDAVGAMHSLDFYFTAEASVSGSGVVTSPEIKLHLDMTAKGDPKATGTIATMLTQLSGSAHAAALAQAMRNFATASKVGTAQLQVTISPASYANIHCVPYANGKPASSNTAADAANWAVFAQAADDLNAWPLKTLPAVSTQTLPYLKEYAAWQKLNLAQTGESTPNRMEFGNQSTSNWPDSFPEIDTGSMEFVIYSLHAGQQFMNFCGALVGLTQIEDTATAGTTWQSLLSLISDAVKNDTNIDFIRPTALAVMRLCGAANAQLAGPSPAAAPSTHFCVTVTL